MSAPLVTIVTPSYNQGRFIRATIETVLAQDYPHLEYIIMDGGSTDATPAIAAEYASRLSFFSEKDRGQSHAINKGFQRAKGEIVAWLNSDDLFLPGSVRRGSHALARHTRAGAAYGEGYLIDREGKITGRFPATEPFNLWKLIYLSDYILQQTVYFRRRVFDQVGFLDESLHWGMDWDVLVRIARRFPLAYVPEFMGCLREYDEAKTFSGGARRLRELARIMRRHGRLRYPPGYFTYGLDTWERILRNWMERLTPPGLGWASKKAQFAVTVIAHRVISRILREAQGLYADGWAGPRLRYMLPAGSSDVVIAGALERLGGTLDGQVMRVHVRGGGVHEFSIPFGNFEFSFKPAPTSEPLEMEIISSRWVVPAADGRRLAFRLKHISWSEDL